MPDFKAFPIRPMVGVFDTLSSGDEVGYGNWRIVKNATTRSTRNRQRGGGWRRLFADDYPYNNEDLHDQLVDRLSYFDSFSAHAMGGGGLSGYGSPYFFPSSVSLEYDVFPAPAGPYCDIYYPQYDGLYAGCPIFYPFVGFPYVEVLGAVITTPLVAHWRMDEASGTRVDVVAGLNLTSIGSILGEGGLIGNAAAIHTGSGRYLTRADGTSFQAGDIRFGLTGWIYRFTTQAATGRDVETIFSKASSGTSPAYMVYMFLDNLILHVSSNGTDSVTVIGPTIQANQWVFFAAWHDPVANTINIKVNDNLTVSAVHSLGVTGTGGGIDVGLGAIPTPAAVLDAKVDSLSFWRNGFPSEDELSMLFHGGMGLDHPFDMDACTTGAPGFYLQSFVYTSCPVHYGSSIVQGYGYGPQFPIYSPQFAYDYIYCGTDLYYRTGCREAVTMLGEIVTSTGRKLISGTMSRVYEYNQSAGNWRILADGLGNAGYTGEQCGCNSVRGSMATMGLYMLYTNGFNPPSVYILGETQENCDRQELVPITDLVALDITRAGGVVVWKGFAIFFDITEGGTRDGGTFIWSHFEDPESYIESDLSLAGRITLAIGETILAMEPLGNWLIAYTDKSFYRITLVGGTDIFNVEEIKGVGGNALKYKYSMINTGSAHIFLAESDVMYFTQFDTAPIHVPWLTKAAGMVFNGIHEDHAEYGPLNKDACDLITGGWSDEKREAWLSWPTGDNLCPNVTLRFNLKFGTADFVDHGFTSFLTFRADLRPTVGQWMEDMGICPRATLVAMGPKDGPPCSVEGVVVEPAPLYIRNPEEDPDLPVHPQSLCARLDGLSMDDFCIDCSAPATFITASAEDFTLKQQEDDYYFREILGGNIESYDAYSCTGQYYTQVGYETVMQLGANDFRTDDEKLVKMIGIEAEPLPQATPSVLQMEVGYGSQSGCLVWKPIRPLDFECKPVADNVRPDFEFYFPTWRRGRYLSGRFIISGIGGGGLFTGFYQTVKVWGQPDSP